MSTDKTFGYGIGSPSISGFPTLLDAAKCAEKWLKEGTKWDKTHQRYVTDMQRRRVIELFESRGNKLWQKVGSVVAIRYYSGNIVTSVWYGQRDYSTAGDEHDLVPSRDGFNEPVESAAEKFLHGLS